MIQALRAVSLLLFAEPPLEVLVSLSPPLVLFRLEAWPQLSPQLEEFLNCYRESAALTYVAFGRRDVFQFSAAFWAVPHMPLAFSIENYGVEGVRNSFWLSG